MGGPLKPLTHTSKTLNPEPRSAGSPEPGAASSSKPLAETAVAACSAALAERFDAQRGGFGSAPKFPRPCELNLLLVYHLTATQAGNAQLAGRALRYSSLLGRVLVTGHNNLWMKRHCQTATQGSTQWLAVEASSKRGLCHADWENRPAGMDVGHGSRRHPHSTSRQWLTPGRLQSRRCTWPPSRC